jgi:CubicO group peptidase (beta-lactamase class C family)
MVKPTKFFMLLSILVTLLLTACSPNAGPVVPTPTRLPLSSAEQEKADYIDDYYTQLVQDGEFYGSVLVEMEGKIIFDRGYGYADRAAETPNTIQTRFRLFNGSKVFTALGIMILAEEGALGLEDPICSHLDDCPSQWADLNVADLLNGDSGLHDYTLVTPIKKSWDQPIDREDFYTLLKGVSMDTGTFVYPLNWEGATDYALLGFIIEAVSGETYADFIQSSVIEPLGLTNTGFVQGTGEEQDLAVFYQDVGDETAEAIDVSNLVGYGNAYSSAEDLYLLIKAIRDGGLLSAESTARMLSPNNYELGYGWMFYEFDEKTWITNNVGFSQTIPKHAVLAWTEDGTMTTIILTNEQDVLPVFHPQAINCLPGVAGVDGMSLWVSPGVGCNLENPHRRE